MKRFLLTTAAAAVISCGCVKALAQEPEEQFTVATLNVDGLPQKILVVKVNADGPGDTGTARIGKYLLKKGYDLVMIQEDFSYHGVLSVLLEDDYKLDEWSGTVGVELFGGPKIDFLHLQNHRFDCDGLMACWKNDLQVTPAARTAWTHSFGKFSHANDEMVTKGFRRYDVTLRNGTRIIVYNMHMDASAYEDEVEQNDGKDRQARQSQWEQLKEDVLKNLDSRPIIITGDLNSLYGVDGIKQTFIDAINDSGRGTASDVWVELHQGGIYPTDSIADESIDKILYINPAMGASIRPVAYSLDKEGYLYEGQPLGDHYPVAAKFRVLTREEEKITGIESLSSDLSTKGEKTIYTIDGAKVNSQQAKGIYIEQHDGKAEKRIVK